MNTPTCTYRILLNQLLQTDESDKLLALHERFRQLVSNHLVGNDRFELNADDLARTKSAKEQGKLPKDIWAVFALRSLGPREMAQWIESVRPSIPEVIQACGGTWNGALMPLYLVEGEAEYARIELVEKLTSNIQLPACAVEEMTKALTPWIKRDHSAADPAVWGVYARAWPELMAGAGRACTDHPAMQIMYLATICHLSYQIKDQKSKHEQGLFNLLRPAGQPNQRVPVESLAEMLAMGALTRKAVGDWCKFWNLPAHDKKPWKVAEAEEAKKWPKLEFHKDFVQPGATTEPQAQLLRWGPEKGILIADIRVGNAELASLWEWILATDLDVGVLTRGATNYRILGSDSLTKWRANDGCPAFDACVSACISLLLPQKDDGPSATARRLKCAAELLDGADPALKEHLRPFVGQAIAYTFMELEWAESAGAIIADLTPVCDAALQLAEAVQLSQKQAESSLAGEYSQSG